MKVTAKVQKTDDILVTLTATMTVQQWRTVRNAILKTQDYHWDAAEFGKMIEEATSRLDQTICSELIDGKISTY